MFLLYEHWASCEVLPSRGNTTRIPTIVELCSRTFPIIIYIYSQGLVYSNFLISVY